MGQNWQFDPTKRDYVTSGGSPVPTDRIEENVYFVLAMPRGRWLYGAPGQGSELYRFKNAKRLSSTEQSFAASVTEAIENQVIAPGKASRVEVSNLQTARQGTSNQIAVEPKQTQVSSQLKFNPV